MALEFSSCWVGLSPRFSLNIVLLFFAKSFFGPSKVKFQPKSQNKRKKLKKKLVNSVTLCILLIHIYWSLKLLFICFFLSWLYSLFWIHSCSFKYNLKKIIFFCCFTRFPLNIPNFNWCMCELYREWKMASASGLLTPSVPSLRRRVQPSTWKYRSGFCFSQGTFRRVLCSSTIAGSEKSVSSSESRAPRWFFVFPPFVSLCDSLLLSFCFGSQNGCSMLVDSFLFSF